MTKDWEKEISKIIREYYYQITSPQEQRNRDIVKELLTVLAKQRTKLLARVREEVLVYEIDMLIEVLEINRLDGKRVADVEGMLKSLRKEQLKKLRKLADD